MKIFEEMVAMLSKHNVVTRVVEHAAEGRCDAISKIRGNKLSQAMKAIVIKAQITKKDSKYFLAVLPGDRAINMDAIKNYSKATKIFFAPAEKAKILTGCEMGAVPPFSFNSDLKLIVDPSIKENEEIVFNAGLLDRSIFMQTKDYIAISNLSWLDFSKVDPSNTSSLTEVKEKAEGDELSKVTATLEALSSSVSKQDIDKTTQSTGTGSVLLLSNPFNQATSMSGSSSDVAKDEVLSKSNSLSM